MPRGAAQPDDRLTIEPTANRSATTVSRSASSTKAAGTSHRPPPERRRAFGLTALIVAIVLSVVVFIVVPSTPLLAWLVAVNAVTLLAFGYDKGIAGGNRTRIPEAVLLGLALIGGTLGAVAGIMLFRHKTSKPAFLVPFALLA